MADNVSTNQKPVVNFSKKYARMKFYGNKSAVSILPKGKQQL